MTTISNDSLNNVELLTIENDHLKTVISPHLGGKILSIYNKSLSKEFLWLNQHLPVKANNPGDDYDSNFIGGMDELIPNDQPEAIDGIPYPDHGELWTTPLDYQVTENTIKVYGTLQICQLHYCKTLHLDNASPLIILDYTIKNTTDQRRHFLWKLHAALQISPGDELITPAVKGQVAAVEYSRFKNTGIFNWPLVENTNAAVIPPFNNQMDFFYLFDLPKGQMQMLGGGKQHLFGVHYDTGVFPYQWYFASYGGFLDHYTAVLEPCTNMPMSVNTAIEKNQCTYLEPGETLTTTVRIFAGEKNKYFQ